MNYPSRHRSNSSYGISQINLVAGENMNFKCTPAPISIDLECNYENIPMVSFWGHLLTGPECHFIRTSADLLTKCRPALSTVMRIDTPPSRVPGMVTTAASTNCRSPSLRFCGTTE
ncbi:hypothetical protein CEXT_195021 [Caerostris extrusa]|uniref:Uncharacterized protein n=1 Tax=Caerostris extrusa TaxID=172846 RepID=A0AAV4M7J7_CAEEX|nr:hypothetical protein CEXT_195021 [Caerostris extrusa]